MGADARWAAGAAEAGDSVKREMEGALAAASARAVSATATEVVREVIMAGTVGRASNRPATGG